MKKRLLPALLLAAALLLAGPAAAAPAALNPPEPEALPAGAVVRALELTPAVKSGTRAWQFAPAEAV